MSNQRWPCLQRTQGSAAEWITFPPKGGPVFSAPYTLKCVLQDRDDVSIEGWSTEGVVEPDLVRDSVRSTAHGDGSLCEENWLRN